ncbi:LysM peptidoglycan-binding domain-containing protein [Lysinibacillus sp. MHQ-1]|nr:LysM peptidoglycan-binding domain-containing protein [Lysinibacillus sp. MHQ-1]
MEDEYVIKGGDTLFSIARKNDITVDELKAWNNLATDLIFAGESIAIKASAAKPKPKTSEAVTPKAATTAKNKTCECSIKWFWKNVNNACYCLYSIL